MAKNIRRMLAMVMVLCMFVAALPLQALAAEETITDTTTETSPEGLPTDVTTTTTTSTDESGNTTVTVTIEKATEGTIDGGVDVIRNENSTTTTTTNADGVVTGEHWSEDGKETKEWTEEDTGDEAGQPEVNVELVPGETTTGTAAETTEVTDENGTTTTTTTDRTVTASVSEVKTTVEKSETDLDSIKSEDEDYADKEGVRYGKAGSDSEMEKGAYWDTNIADGEGEPKPDEPGYDFQNTGIDEIALDPYRTNVWTVTYARDEAGNVMTDENGDPIIASKIAVNPSGNHSTGWDDLGYPTQTTIKVLTQYGENGEKERFFAYCIDKETGLVDGSWYSIANLEDSDYYVNEESEAHLRAIVTNGYWGTKEGTGSIAQIKESMLAAYTEDDVITVTDKNGDEQTFKVVDLIGDLCEGEALNVTQAAIWSYSNGAISVQTGENNILVNDNFSYALSKNTDALVGAQSLARMRVMYSWLLSLEQEKSENDTTVINEKNFVENMSLTIGDKVADHAANQDEDKDNDVYNASLNFTLAFVPGENDDLLVQITYTDLDGKNVTVTRRLAGTNSEGQSYEDIKPEADGSYVLKGLKLSENKELNFDLRIEGTQYLEEGVYIYTPYGGRDASQTLVGLAEGERQVSVTTGMTIKFDVDENNHVVAERTWHNESNPTYTPGEDTPVVLSEEAGDGPRIYRLGRNDGTVEIPDEEVPLAKAPTTGDESGLWIAVILMAAVALYVVNVISKKRQHETF